MQCLAVIPARGGSKRIKKKNTRDFMNKPIISYTIEAANSCGLFSQVIVSTDSHDIAQIAEQYGAQVPFIRDPQLADNHTPVSEVTLDAVLRLDPDGEIFDHVAQLMPNCPLRTSTDIQRSYKRFLETDADSQISVTRYNWLNPWWAATLTEEGQIVHLHTDMLNKRSQDLPEIYCPTGAIWWAKTEHLRREKTFHTPNKKGWEISWEHSVDIDEEIDWAFAEFLWIKNTKM